MKLAGCRTQGYGEQFKRTSQSRTPDSIRASEV